MADELTMLSLPDFQPSKSGSDADGVDPTIVSRACEELEGYAANLDSFIENLIAQKERIAQGWEGQAKVTFESQFADMLSAFNEIPKSVNSISEWASSYTSIMVSIDDATTEGLNTILGGAK